MGMDYTPQPNFNAVAGRVKAPAIAMIVVTALGILHQLVNIVLHLVGSGVNAMSSFGSNPDMPPQLARFLNMMGGGLGVLFGLFDILVGAFIIFGALKMMNLQNYGLALAASIVIMIPCLAPCCCVVGLPFGIWSVVVLSNAEVKAAFR